MGYKLRVCKGIVLAIMFSLSIFVYAKAQTFSHIPENNIKSSLLSLKGDTKQNNLSKSADSLFNSKPFIHNFSTEIRPEYIFPTNVFLKGENATHKPLRHSFSTHLKYSFQFYPNTFTDRIYGRAYQGFGLARYSFGDKEELGNPVLFYLFQGARISRFASFLSLNYEWNFGLSFGWKPYNIDSNPYNRIIGSKVNAYINTNLYLNWILSRKFDLTTGITITHFSNGNTRFPNKGLNTTGGKLGLVYNINRKSSLIERIEQPAIPKFPRHISYDFVMFGSWRRAGVDFQDGQIASPEIYPVFGFYFAPMYNVGYKFRFGVSIDGTYDGGANIYTQDFFAGSQQKFFKPPLEEQLALGFSGRAEYIMPYFTIGVGIGKNIKHNGGDMDINYQSLALKIEVTRNSYINIGYSLQDFHEPNFLMLGVGYRFNNKYPVFYR